MGYKSGADGVTKTGRTKGKNLGDSGPTVANYKGPKAAKSSLNTDMKKVGRNLARAKNQG